MWHTSEPQPRSCTEPVEHQETDFVEWVFCFIAVFVWFVSVTGFHTNWQWFVPAWIVVVWQIHGMCLKKNEENRDLLWTVHIGPVCGMIFNDKSKTIIILKVYYAIYMQYIWYMKCLLFNLVLRPGYLRDVYHTWYLNNVIQICIF